MLDGSALGAKDGVALGAALGDNDGADESEGLIEGSMEGNAEIVGAADGNSRSPASIKDWVRRLSPLPYPTPKMVATAATQAASTTAEIIKARRCFARKALLFTSGDPDGFSGVSNGAEPWSAVSDGAVLVGDGTSFIMKEIVNQQRLMLMLLSE
mmetsp:Transcript_5957/g.11062  ORF Transcript_5957/g.11062 Transcript_5957/m.11062 type:complete len:155 (-) Transcript_5957:13-477(-)